MKDLGESVLGIEIHQDWKQGTLYICQPAKILELLHYYHLHNLNPITTPMEPGLNLLKLDCTAN